LVAVEAVHIQGEAQVAGQEALAAVLIAARHRQVQELLDKVMRGQQAFPDD
jgi:hypothetical protein